MNRISLAGQSLFNASAAALNISALNTANLQTDGYRARRVAFYSTPGGVNAAITEDVNPPDLATERLTQLKSTQLSQAGTKLIRTEDEMLGELFDQWA